MVFPVEALLIIFASGMVIAVILGVRTEWRLNRLLRGKSGKTLEDIVIKNEAGIERFRIFRRELEAYLETVEKRLDQSVRGVGTVRFNPFHGTGDGGNQSFATALIDEKGDGVVFSTLHTRERMSIFAKPLTKFTSTYELTGEERGAIKKAQEKLRA